MSNPWIEEAWRALIIALISLLVGWLIGHMALALLLGLGAYAGWHMRQVYRLERWLRHGKHFHPPEANGIWEEIFQQIYRLQQRNRKRKRKLGSMLNRFQQATAAMPDAIVVLENERIEWWNNAAETVFGLHYPRDVGQSVGNLLRHPDFIAYMRADRYDSPIQIPSPSDPQVTVSIRLIAYGGNQRLLVARDISRLQQLERMRRDFVANVSHELRTPLTVVSGYLETLLDDKDDVASRRWRKTLQVMHEQSNRMQGIVADLLTLSRLETQPQSDQQTPVAVPGMLAAITDDARRLSGEQGHQISLDADPGVWLLGSESELRSLFSNLAFNAVRYTPAGGRIQMRWYADPTGAHFEIKDTGIGIAAHHLPRLTERFYRIDVGRSRGSGGTGLGLAIVKHVLLRHGGQLRVDSRLGEGSTFHCDFAEDRVYRQARPAVG